MATFISERTRHYTDSGPSTEELRKMVEHMDREEFYSKTPSQHLMYVCCDCLAVKSEYWVVLAKTQEHLCAACAAKRPNRFPTL